MNYDPADRYIPATKELLTGWWGPVEVWIRAMGGTTHNGAWVAESWNSHAVYASEKRRLDPMRAEVRDHLVRRLSLPAWLRDGAGLEPWQSAGLIACATAGAVPVGLLNGWATSNGAYHRSDTNGLHVCQVRFTPFPGSSAAYGWRLCYLDGWEQIHGTETSDAGKTCADTAALAHGYALMLDADTMALPWPGSARVWRRA